MMAESAIWTIVGASIVMTASIQPTYPKINITTALAQDHRDAFNSNHWSQVLKDNYTEIKIRPISPRYEDHFSYAIEIESVLPAISINISKIGLNASSIYRIEDSREQKNLGCYNSTSVIKLQMDSTGEVCLRAISKDPNQSYIDHCQNVDSRNLSILVVFIILFGIVGIFTFTFSQLWKKKKTEEYLDLTKNMVYGMTELNYSHI